MLARPIQVRRCRDSDPDETEYQKHDAVSGEGVVTGYGSGDEQHETQEHHHE
jgi:hypothetical protein